MSLESVAAEHARGVRALRLVSKALKDMGVRGVAPQLALALYRASRCGGGMQVKRWHGLTGQTNGSYLSSRAAELGLVDKQISGDDARAYSITLTPKALAMLSALERQLGDAAA